MLKTNGITRHVTSLITLKGSKQAKNNFRLYHRLILIFSTLPTLTLCSQKNKQIILTPEHFSSLFWYRKCACRSSTSQAMLQVPNSACSPPIHASDAPRSKIVGGQDYLALYAWAWRSLCAGRAPGELSYVRCTSNSLLRAILGLIRLVEEEVGG
jgi:hypothetical protein